MAGGNSHQRRAKERAARAHLTDQVTEAVLARIPQTDAAPPNSANKSFATKLLDSIERPLVLGALLAVAGIVGAIFYTPIFIVCAVGILLGLRRAGVISGP